MEREVEGLVNMYEQRRISRRALIEGLVAITLGSRMFAQGTTQTAPVVHARTLNHVTLYSSDVGRSKKFYQHLAGLPVRDEGAGFCELKLEGAFLGIYAPDQEQRPGIDHFCLGIDSFDANRLLSELQRAVPDAQPVVRDGQVYVRDPDGALVQFAGVKYKL